MEGVIQKVRLLKTYSFWAPRGPCLFLFILDVPPSTYFRFSELPPYQKRFRDAYGAYFEKKIRG